MKQGYYKIPRRSFLKGAGVCLALPSLEIMGAALSKEERKIPLRLGVLHKGNGIDPSGWETKGTETNFTLAQNLQPLKSQIKDVVFLANISNQGKGDHYGAVPLLMTGIQNRNPKYTFDQVIADKIGNDTQFKSFHLSADPVDIRSTTLNTMSHDKEGRPLFVERNAQFAFDRLFRGLGDKNVRREMSSVLDAVRRPAAELIKKASSTDRQVISNYLDSVRDVEKAIHRQENTRQRPNLDKVKSAIVNVENFPAKIKTMSDLMALAFWTDSTRVMTFNMAQESSRRIHDFIGLKADYHWSSHFDKNKKLAVEFNAANTWYIMRLAMVMEKMKQLKEHDGSSVFDNSVLMFGSGLSHGGKHWGGNLPLLVAGGKNSGLNTGRFIRCEKEVPQANLLLTLIQHFGVEQDKYSNATGTLDRVRKL